MNLPDPPLLQHLFLENPWPVVATTAALAAIVGIVAWRRAQSRLLLGSAALLLVGVAVLTLANLVVTPREQLIQETRELIGRTAPLDLPRLRACFDSRAVLLGPDGSMWMGFEEIFNEVERTLTRWPVSRQQVREVQAATTSPDRGLTMVQLRSELPVYSQGIGSRWLLTWTRARDGQWRVLSVQWLELEGQAPTIGMWRQ